MGWLDYWLLTVKFTTISQIVPIDLLTLTRMLPMVLMILLMSDSLFEFRLINLTLSI